MKKVNIKNIGTDKALSRDHLRNLSRYEVVKIYRSMFKDSPHCHSDEPELWEEIYDAILTGIPQKMDPTWD